jgi:DNA polymerase-1
MHIALDTETFLIYPGYLAPEMVCVSWAIPDKSGLFHHSDETAFEFVYECFEKHDTIFANAPFDLAVFMAKWPEMTDVIFQALVDGRVHDVLTREKLLDLARGTFRFEEDEEGNVKAKGYSLFEVAMRRLGERLDKDTWRLRYHELHDVPLEQWPAGARHYAITDSVSALEIFERQEQLSQYLGDEAAQVRAAMALYLISCRGFMTDPKAVKELETRVRADIEKIRDGLISAGLVRKNGTRDTKAAVRSMIDTGTIVWTDAAQNILNGDHKDIQVQSESQLVEIAKEQGKFVSVAEDPCIMSGSPILRDYSQYTKLSSLLTGSIKDLRTGCTVPIQSRYEGLMETGRTSSSKPPIQNLRRTPGVRECFVPRDGHVLVACDYSAAELHTLAQICYDLFRRSKLGDALNSGTDVHAWVGARLLRIEYNEMIERLRAGDEEAKNARQVAKAANFGFPGGCGFKRFVGFAHGYGCDITEREGAQLKALWLASWPEMEDYFRHVRECSTGNGFYWVKQSRVERLRGKCTYTSACNSPFQGLAADGAKAAGFEITRRQFTEPDSALWGTGLLAFVHDEYILEAPEERAHEAAMEMQSVMEECFNRFVPDCPTKAEPTIMRRWSKKAVPVYRNERLVPWEA